MSLSFCFHTASVCIRGLSASGAAFTQGTWAGCATAIAQGGVGLEPLAVSGRSLESEYVAPEDGVVAIHGCSANVQPGPVLGDRSVQHTVLMGWSR